MKAKKKEALIYRVTFKYKGKEYFDMVGGFSKEQALERFYEYRKEKGLTNIKVKEEKI